MAGFEGKERQQFGTSWGAETTRHRRISSLFGNTLAEKEIQNNLRAYRREFLDDEAVALPQTYHLLHDELYSQQIDHPLFNIKGQIDPRERQGATLAGFKQYERQIANASLDSVGIWYSPDGPSGFEGINFDAGRLYFSFKTGHDHSTHFDIKVRPEFPILSLLGDIQEQTNGTHPRFDTPEVGKMYYLTHPIQTSMGVNEFFAYMEQYASKENNSIYISRRNSKNPEIRTLSSTMREMKKMLEKQGEKRAQIFEPIGDKTTTAMMREEDLMRRYLAVIQPYVEKNNGTYALYGCSTTSTVSSEDIQGLIAQNSVGNVISLHSTQRRLLTNERGNPLSRDTAQTDSFPCPKCQRPILSGEGRTSCPHCGITKEKYADEVGGPTCA